MRAFADNWELTGNRPYDLVRSSEFLNELARLNRLEFSSDKCYAWNTGTELIQAALEQKKHHAANIDSTLQKPLRNPRGLNNSATDD